MGHSGRLHHHSPAASSQDETLRRSRRYVCSRGQGAGKNCPQTYSAGFQGISLSSFPELLLTILSFISWFCSSFSPPSFPSGTKWKFPKTRPTRTCVSKSPAAWTSRSIWNTAGEFEFHRCVYEVCTGCTMYRTIWRPIYISIYKSTSCVATAANRYGRLLLYCGSASSIRVGCDGSVADAIFQKFPLFNFVCVSQVLVRLGQRRLEKVEETLLRPRSSFAVHLRHVQLQGEEDGAVWNVPAGRLHGGLHRSRQRYVKAPDFRFEFGLRRHISRVAV